MYFHQSYLGDLQVQCIFLTGFIRLPEAVIEGCRSKATGWKVTSVMHGNRCVKQADH